MQIIKKEEKLQNDEGLLFKILNASQNGIQVYKSIRDEQGEIQDFEWIMVNDAVLKFWGKTREEVIGKKMLELFPGVKQDGLFDFYLLGAKSDEHLNIQKFYNHEGFNHWLDLSVVRFGDGLIISSQDITKQKEAEEKLKTYNLELEKKVLERTLQLELQKEELNSLFMQSPALVAIVKGEEFIFELANPLYLKFFGKKKDLVGKPLLDVFPEVSDQPILNILKKVFRSGERYIGVEVMVKLDINNDGNFVDSWFNFVYEPYRNASGAVAGILFHGFDVTEQFLARKKIEESEERLTVALEAGNMGTWELDLIHDKSIRSKEHDIIFGYNEGVSEWGARTFMEHIVPEDKALGPEVVTIEQLQSGNYQGKKVQIQDVKFLKEYNRTTLLGNHRVTDDNNFWIVTTYSTSYFSDYQIPEGKVSVTGIVGDWNNLLLLEYYPDIFQ